MAWKQSLVMGDTWITDILTKNIFIIEKEGYYYLHKFIIMNCTKEKYNFKSVICIQKENLPMKNNNTSD